MFSYSIVLPAKNEAAGLRILLPRLCRIHPDAEIIVVDDGSTDETVDICLAHKVNVVSHPYSMGNGAAIKTGARNATSEIIAFMDADGQHKPEDIHRLLDVLDDGYDMVVGARDSGSQASVARGLGNGLYNRLASYMTERKIEDLTSGMRVVRARKFREFLYLLPNGFSYPTTSTMAFFRAGYAVSYLPISTPERIGKSHINLLKDGMRFLLIIFKVGTLYSPLKLFTPISAAMAISGFVYYLYTYLTGHRFTNMGVVLFTSSLMIFMMGLISEQITALMYRTDQQGARDSGSVGVVEEKEKREPKLRIM